MRQRTAADSRQFTGGTLRLRLGLSLLHRRQMLMLLLPSLVIAGVLALQLDPRVGDGLLRDFARTLTAGSLAQRLEACFMLLLTALAVCLVIATRRARIEISSLGLQALVPRGTGLGLQRMTTGRCRVGWNQVESVSLRAGPRSGGLLAYLQNTRLVIRTRERQLVLSPFLWVNADGPDHRLSFAEALRSGRTFDDGFLERAPLMRALRSRGITIETAADSAPAGAGPSSFDLAGHGGMVLQLIVLALAGGYALIDGFATGPYQPLESLPVVPFVVTAAVACTVVLATGRGAPAAERAAVAALAVAALLAAVYPALHRINGWTGEPVTVPYAVIAPARLTPPSPTLPPIDLTHLRLDEYWAQFAPGATHPMTVVRGIGGYWQLDTRPLFERTRRFYRGSRADRSDGSSGGPSFASRSAMTPRSPYNSRR